MNFLRKLTREVIWLHYLGEITSEMSQKTLFAWVSSSKKQLSVYILIDILLVPVISTILQKRKYLKLIKHLIDRISISGKQVLYLLMTTKK